MEMKQMLRTEKDELVWGNENGSKGVSFLSKRRRIGSPTSSITERRWRRRSTYYSPRYDVHRHKQELGLENEAGRGLGLNESVIGVIERASEVGNGSWVIGWLSPNDWAACQKVGCFWTGFFFKKKIWCNKPNCLFQLSTLMSLCGCAGPQSLFSFKFKIKQSERHTMGFC